MKNVILGAALILASASLAQAGSGRNAAYDAMVARHAKANSVPESLVHRVIMRESRYNPRAVSKGNYGMMQIRHATARGLGYKGGTAGLLDAETNLTYAVRYLANAYAVAGGNHDRAVSLYASGYYYAAKRKGMLARLKGPVIVQNQAPAVSASAAAVPVQPAAAIAPAAKFAVADNPAIDRAAGNN